MKPLLYSLLRKERERRGWTRAYVEAMTEKRITIPSLVRWEDGESWPRYESILILCQLYGKSAQELGLDQNSAIIDSQQKCIAPQEEEGTYIMSDPIRRAVLNNLYSRLTGLIDTWPRRNYQYQELQNAISDAVVNHSMHTSVEDNLAEMNRREALKSTTLVVPQLICGNAWISGRTKTDNDILLKYCAAGIAASWHLRRSRDLGFISDVMSTYISVLQPLIYAHSEAHRKAATGLLSQSFRLKGSIVHDTENSNHLQYLEQALEHGVVAGDPLAQALAYRQRSIAYYGEENYRKAIIDIEHAKSLIDSQTDTGIQAQIYAGLAECLAADGKMDQALPWLKKAFQVFDPTKPIPVHVQFSSAILSHNSGNVYRYGEQWGAAADCYNEGLVSQDASALGTMQVAIRRAQVEACRDDKPRDMDRAVSLLSQGIKDAKVLGSQRYLKEARKVYQLLIAAWPHENTVKSLGKQFLGKQF